MIWWIRKNFVDIIAAVNKPKVAGWIRRPQGLTCPDDLEVNPFFLFSELPWGHQEHCYVLDLVWYSCSQLVSHSLSWLWMSYIKQEVDAVPFIAAMLALLDKATLYRVAEHAWLRIFLGKYVVEGWWCLCKDYRYKCLMLRKIVFLQCIKNNLLFPFCTFKCFRFLS